MSHFMDFVFVFISPLVFLDLISVSPWLCHYVQVCLVNYPHLLSHISCSQFSVSLSGLVYVTCVCVCVHCPPDVDYPYVDGLKTVYSYLLRVHAFLLHRTVTL